MKEIFIDTLQIHSNTKDFGYLVQIPIQGLEAPSYRLSSYQKPGEHGAFVSNLLYGDRRITLEGLIFANSLSAYELKRRGLEEILSVKRDSNGVPIPKLLKFKTQDDKSLQVNVHPASKPKIDITNLTNGRFLIDLIAEDYVLEDQSSSSTSLTPPTGGGIIYAVIYPVTYASATGGSETIVNNGNAESWPILTLDGPLTNPRVFSQTLDREMVLNMNLALGDQVIIDMKNKTIIQGGITNRLNKKTDESKWWWLDPGSNQIIFSTTSSGDTGSCKIAYRDAYVGV